jgi:hypothetical protein
VGGIERHTGHGDGTLQVLDPLATLETLSGIHGNGTAHTATKVLGNLKDELDVVVLDLESAENGREGILGELDVDDGTDDLHDLAVGIHGLGLGLGLAGGLGLGLGGQSPAAWMRDRKNENTYSFEKRQISST